MRLRLALGVAFLAVQVARVIGGQFSESKSFRWAPQTTQIWYELDARVHGQPLNARAIRRRYGIPRQGWEAHSIQDVKEIVKQHARTYGRHDGASVTIRYSVNGGPTMTWSWPE